MYQYALDWLASLYSRDDTEMLWTAVVVVENENMGIFYIEILHGVLFLRVIFIGTKVIILIMKPYFVFGHFYSLMLFAMTFTC